MDSFNDFYLLRSVVLSLSLWHTKTPHFLNSIPYCLTNGVQFSIAALIVSILPLAALAPSLLHLSLSDGVRTAWAGANIVFVLLGLILSVVCVRSKESRSLINIASTAISVFWALLMAGIVVLALFLTFVQ